MFGFFTFCQIAVVVMLYAEFAHSAPVPVFGVVYPPSMALSTPYDAGPGHRLLKWAVEGAARQVGFMKTTVESARQQDAASLQKLKDVFGELFNMDEIEKTIDVLDSGILTIDSWHATFPDANILAVASKVKHAVEIGNEFYNDVTTPDWLRIGVIIHEATHLLSGTTDSWEWSDNSKTSIVPTIEAFDSSHSLSGQWDNDYNLIKENADSFHLNADTWFVFGYYLEHGTLPPHNPASSPNPSTRRLKFVDVDQLDFADPDLLTFGPSQWFTVIPNLG